MNTPIKPPCTNVGPGRRLISPGGIDLTNIGQQSTSRYANQAAMQTFSRRDIKMPDYGTDKEDEQVAVKSKHVGGITLAKSDEVHVIIFKMHTLSDRDYSFMRKASTTHRGKAFTEFLDTKEKLEKNMKNFPNVGGELMLCTMNEEAFKRFSAENIVLKYNTMADIKAALGKNIRDNECNYCVIN